jgi:hypothetical protein
MIRAGNREYGYDNNGNLLFEQTSAQRIDYGYTVENRMESYRKVSLEPSNLDDVESLVGYRYDGMGRRVGRTSQEDSGGVINQRYEYDGFGFSFARVVSESFVGQLEMITSDGSASEGTRYRPAPGSVGSGQAGSLTAEAHRYIHGNNRVLSRSGSGTDLVYTQDRLGSVRRESGQGGMAQEFRYDV